MLGMEWVDDRHDVSIVIQGGIWVRSGWGKGEGRL
jgi:hypothetical protein